MLFCTLITSHKVGPDDLIRHDTYFHICQGDCTLIDDVLKGLIVSELRPDSNLDEMFPRLLEDCEELRVLHVRQSSNNVENVPEIIAIEEGWLGQFTVNSEAFIDEMRCRDGREEILSRFFECIPICDFHCRDYVRDAPIEVQDMQGNPQVPRD